MRYHKFSDSWLIVASGIITLVVLSLAGNAGAATLIVNASGGADYMKIQDGIDNANVDDTVLVHGGIYYENLNVNKPLVLKGIDNGWGKPVVNAMGSGNAITLDAENITLEGFTVVNASMFDYGIYVYYSGNNTLSNNNVSNSRGIYLYYSGNNTLIGNDVKTSRVSGYAINLFNSSDNKLIGNNLSDNYNGIYLSNSNSTLIGNNNISDSQEGILVSFSSNNTLVSNNVLNNDRGIMLASSTNNVLSENNISDNREGIYLGGSSSNTLVSNNALNNSAGIYLYRSGDNTIYNNFFNNTNNLKIFQIGYNKWNITATNGTNIIGGLYISGNVWANPGGTAFSQTCEDVNNDGICDSSLTIDSNNIDYLPLAYAHEFPTVIVNLSGTPVVNQSTIYILSVDYRNFNNGSPYNISITRKDDDSIVYMDNGMLKGELKETILINWTPITTGEYLVASKGDNTTAVNRIMFVVNAGAKMLIVDDNDDSDYTSIQDAVDNSNDGDAILVYSGTYGGVYVNRQLILKGIDNGGGKPIIDASAGCMDYVCVHYGPGNAVTLGSGNSTLDGFTVTGGWSFAIPRSGGIDVVSNNNLIKNNKISENKYGIILRGSANILSGNEILNNSLKGIDLEDSGNTIYNNLLNNSNNFEIYNNSSNKWNITRANGTNIMGSPYLGGNFWEGFSQACMDVDTDGICDAQYTLDSNNTDYLPLAYKPLNIDMTPPVINSVTLNNSAPTTGDPILVTVDAADDVEVTGVMANDISLNNQDANTWNGTINALDGTHSVNVSASDAVGNIAWNNSTYYTANHKISPGGPGGINGKVTYSNNGTGITGASVSLANITGIITSTTTDDSGSYSISGIPEGNYSVNVSKMAFFANSTSITLNSSETKEVNFILGLKEDFNNNGVPTDAGDLVLMKRASIGEIEADSMYDLNNNGQFADAGDLVLMKRASIGEIIK